MRIIIDVDDVVLDLLSEWLNAYNSDYEDNLKPEDITSWELTDFVKPECGPKIYDYLKRDDIYDFVHTVKGAIDGVARLRYLGHELLFVTAMHHPAKRLNLAGYGFILGDDKDSYIVAHDKSVIAADVIVDDNPETVANFPGRGILFTREHNKSFIWGRRANTWDEVVKLVEEIAGESEFDLTIGGDLTISSDVSVVVPGIGKDAPMAVNDLGGKQSKLDYRFDLMDPLTLFQMANILADGADKYGAWNWRRISVDENLNHALSHILAHMAGDQQDDHLGHAFTRLMFALSVHITPDESPRMMPED